MIIKYKVSRSWKSSRREIFVLDLENKIFPPAVIADILIRIEKEEYEATFYQGTRPRLIVFSSGKIPRRGQVEIIG